MMALQAAQYDLSTAFLDQPDVYAYSTVRGAGNRILQQELTDKSRIVFHILGKGRWDSILRLWINNILVALPSANVHFHPGDDGEIGFGTGAVSTGGDQHVDSFFSLIPGGLDPITFSRYAWMALKVPADSRAPSADLTVLGDFKARQVRIFDNTGTQTSFAWTDNWAWIICDYLIEKFILREGKVNQPLVTAELARFDWQSFVDAAAYNDALLSLGQKRFSDGGVVYLNDSDTASSVLEQMLLLSRSFLREPNGKLTLYSDKPRASVFTFTSDNTKAGSFRAYETNLRTAYNRFVGSFRDSNVASGSADDATRFAISSVTVDHEAHQRSIGIRGMGLSLISKARPLNLDLGVNTPERSWRLLRSMAIRQLGDDVDANTPYKSPRTFELTAFEDSDKVEPGDVGTIDSSISEEHAGRDFEVTEINYNPDGERGFVGLEYVANGFPDVAPAQQVLQAPIPGTGLPPAGSPAGKNMIVNPGFEVNDTGTAIDTDLASGAFCGSSWQVGQLSVYSKVWLASGSPRSGGRGCRISLQNSVLVPNDSVDYVTNVITSQRFYLAVGDIVRISAWIFEFRTAVPPAGVTIQPQVYLSFYDVNDAFLGFSVQLAPSDWSGTYVLSQGAVQVPATIGGSVPAYCRLSIQSDVKNASGAAWNTGSTFTFGDAIFDDVKLVIQSLAAELTPLNTSGHATVPGGALSQSGVSGTILVASRTIQYGFGPVTYSAGSVSPGLGTWFVYADDPTYSGGAVTYVASATESDVYGSDFRLFFGKITLAGGGGGVSIDPPGTGGGRKSL